MPGLKTRLRDTPATGKMTRLALMPCDQIVSTKRQADNDHIASCKNGSRYQVYMNAQGRVVAQKQ